MRNQMTLLLIRLAAVIAAGTAFYQAFPDFGLKYLWFIASVFWYHYADWGLITWFLLGFLVNPVIPVAKLIAAYGLLRFRPWAWRAAVIPLTVDLLFRLTGAINFAIQFYRYREFQIPEGHRMVQVISMTPSYIIGLLSAFAILFLLRPSVKRKFGKSVGEHIA
jgi:hypothetical protein